MAFLLAPRQALGIHADPCPHMMEEPAAMPVVGAFALQVERLRKDQCGNKVIGHIRITNNKESSRFPVARQVKLKLVITHDLP